MTKKAKMNRLIEGGEPTARINMLISFTSIKSDKMISALHKKYSDGWSDELLIQSGYDISNVRRACATLNEVADTYTLLCEYDGLVKKSVK